MATTLKEYFETTTGIGVLSTADAGLRVDAAIYARPHVMDDGTVAFIMRERLTHENLQSNPFAAYLFMEKSQGYKGLRLFLKKLREDANSELIESMTRRCLDPELDAQTGPKHLVYFKVEKILPLIGSGETPVTG
jgi:Pyridoxamine 5'-phosphate oxidase